MATARGPGDDSCSSLEHPAPNGKTRRRNVHASFNNHLYFFGAGLAGTGFLTLEGGVTIRGDRAPGGRPGGETPGLRGRGG
jgi:hypothetical protein